MNIIKIKGIEFLENELKEKYFNENKKYIIKYKNIYELKYSNVNGFYAIDIYKNNNKNDVGYTRKGRFIIKIDKYV